MIKLKKLCEEELTGLTAGLPIEDRIWEYQLQAKQILVSGEIRENLIEKAVMQIFNMNVIDDSNEAQIIGYQRTPITIFINSPGGYIDEAFSLVSAIEDSRTPIHTVCLGKAYSAGFTILLAGHKRFAQRHSSMMYHQGAAGYIGKFCDIIEYAEYFKMENERIEDYVISKTKIKKKKLQEIFSTKKDWYMDTKQALEFGVIDGIWGQREEDLEDSEDI